MATYGNGIGSRRREGRTAHLPRRSIAPLASTIEISAPGEAHRPGHFMATKPLWLAPPNTGANRRDYDAGRRSCCHPGTSLGQMSTRQMKKWVWANPERAHQLAQRLNPPGPPDLGGDASGPAEGASHRGCGHGGGGSWKQSGRGTAVAKHDVGLAAVVTPGYLGGADLEPPGDTSECRAVEGDNSTHFIMATNPSRAAGIGQRVALGELVDQLGSASPASPPA